MNFFRYALAAAIIAIMAGFAQPTTAEVNVALKCDLSAVETDLFGSETGWIEYPMVDGLAIVKMFADSSGYIGFVTREKVTKLIEDFRGCDIRVQKFSMIPSEAGSIYPSNTQGLFFVVVTLPVKKVLLIPVAFNVFGMGMHRPDGSVWHNAAVFRWSMQDSDLEPWPGVASLEDE